MATIETLVKPTASERGGSDTACPGDAAIARAVQRCRPLVIRPSAIPGGDVIAAAIDACASGRTAYTATDGEGLLRMAPALFRASHLGLPIVMTVRGSAGRRDHSHAMALRDCGWVQLYPSDVQDAVDTHIQAFRIAELLSLPVMVCTDTFVGARTVDPPRVPSVEEIDAFLERGNSRGRPRPVDADARVDVYTEMRHLSHTKQRLALSTIWQVTADFRMHFGRRSGGLLSTHRLCAAKLVVLGLGSTFEALCAAADDLTENGISVGAVGLRSFRPFPGQDVRAALLHCQRVVIVERAVAVGIGGIVSAEVRSAVTRLPIQTHTVIAGLGDRTISPPSLQRVLYQAAHGTLEELSFLDVNPERDRNV